MGRNLYFNSVHPDDADPRVLREQDLLNLMEFGGLDDWRPLLRVLREEPRGEVAARLEAVLDLVEGHGVAEFFQLKLNRYRGIPLDEVVTVPRPERFWGI